MSNPKKPIRQNLADEYVDADKRRDDALRNALNTPAQPKIKKKTKKVKKKT